VLSRDAGEDSGFFPFAALWVRMTGISLSATSFLGISRPYRFSMWGKGTSDLVKYLMVGIGGGLGSILRFWLGSYIGSKMGTRFPYGTFVINITGSFLIGLVFAFLTARTQWSPNWRYLIPIGFIGGYTTFSSFEFETLRTMQDGQIGLGLFYVAASVVVGFVAVWGGMVAGRAMVG
jgi:CrcB protein